MKYRIKHDGPRFIAERKRWFGWQKLRGGHYWAMNDEIYTPGVERFNTVRDAEEAIKTAVIANGLAMAHTRVAKSLPPWSGKA